MSLAFYMERFLLAARAALRHGGVRWALALAFVIAAPEVHAQGITLKSARVEAVEEGWQLDAEFDIQFSPKLEEAVNRGVPLYFVLDFEMTRPRWYWFDERTATEKLELRLSYLPLAQQYRLSSGSLYQNFPTLAEALQALGRVHGWTVLGQDQVDNGRRYDAAVRLRLDPAQLPTPFRVSSVTNREWTLASGWKRFPFVPLAPVREAR